MREWIEQHTTTEWAERRIYPFLVAICNQDIAQVSEKQDFIDSKTDVEKEIISASNDGITTTATKCLNWIQYLRA